MQQDVRVCMDTIPFPGWRELSCMGFYLYLFTPANRARRAIRPPEVYSLYSPLGDNCFAADEPTLKMKSDLCFRLVNDCLMLRLRH